MGGNEGSLFRVDRFPEGVNRNPHALPCASRNVPSKDNCGLLYRVVRLTGQCHSPVGAALCGRPVQTKHRILSQHHTPAGRQPYFSRMKESWDLELMTLLQEARGDKPENLDALLKKYAPFAVANAGSTKLLFLRHFEVRVWEDQRSVMNCAPEAGGDFQWGITVVTASPEGGGSQSNVYLPNTNTYTGLEIDGIEVAILMEDAEPVKTNVTELLRKLRCWGKCTEADIETDFKTLSNEQYEIKPHVKPVVKEKVISLAGNLALTYEEPYEWYKGPFEEGGMKTEIFVYHTTPEKLQKLFGFVEAQLASRFYEKALLAMEPEMLELKNDVWTGEDEETGEEEAPITSAVFRQRVSVNTIIFYDDFSTAIYCDDDNLFFGHSIEISVDQKGNYKGASLAG